MYIIKKVKKIAKKYNEMYFLRITSYNALILSKVS